MPGQLVLFVVEPVDARPRARMAAAPSTRPAVEGEQVSLFEFATRRALFELTRHSERIVLLRGAARRSVERVINRATTECCYWRRWARPDGGA